MQVRWVRSVGEEELETVFPPFLYERPRNLLKNLLDGVGVFSIVKLNLIAMCNECRSSSIEPIRSLDMASLGFTAFRSQLTLLNLA